MRKFKGIMINGEWLGDRVIINGVFRAICAISPKIMSEFVHLINKLDESLSQFTVTSFEFSNTDGIKIYFSNDKFVGIADLAFCLKKNELKLQSSILDLQPKNLKEIIAEEKQNQKISEKTLIINETSEVTSLIENNNLETESSMDDFSKEQTEKEKNNSQTIETNSDATIEAIEPTLDIKENQSLNQEEAGEDINKESCFETNELPETTEEQNQLKKEELLEKVADHTASVMTTNPIVIEVIQTAPQTSTPQTVLQPEKVGAEKREEIIHKEQKIEENSEEKRFENIESLEAIENFIEDEVNITKREKKVINNINEEYFDITNEDFTSVNLETNLKLNSDEKIEDSFEKKPFKFDRSELETEIVSDENLNNENVTESVLILDTAKNIDIEELDDEDAEACLLDMYSTLETEIEEPENNIKLTASPEDFMMQAVLAEMVALKEELDILKSEPSKKITAEEFFGGTDNSISVKDEDADFKIWSSTDKINAAILDEECFIAGEKLYRWGETLYLED